LEKVKDGVNVAGETRIHMHEKEEEKKVKLEQLNETQHDIVADI